MTVKLPKVADSVDEVVVAEVMVEPGQAVDAGHVLLRVETDKALVDVPSPVAGTIEEVLVSQDAEIVTGAAIVVLTTS